MNDGVNCKGVEMGSEWAEIRRACECVDGGRM